MTTIASRAARGRFITFEGGEGTGKSTQLRILADRIGAAGIRLITTREPGGSPGAEIIRYLLLQGMGQAIGGDAEALLFAAARDDHVHHVIAPALTQGTWVLCDRFADSTRVYQGGMGRTDPRLLEALERVTLGGLRPDLTFVLDLPAEIGLQRADARRGSEAADRFESQGLAYHTALRDAYRQLAADHPERCVLIDAQGAEDDVAARIWREARARLPELAQTPERASAASKA